MPLLPWGKRLQGPSSASPTPTVTGDMHDALDYAADIKHKQKDFPHPARRFLLDGLRGTLWLVSMRGNAPRRAAHGSSKKLAAWAVLIATATAVASYILAYLDKQTASDVTTTIFTACIGYLVSYAAASTTEKSVETATGWTLTETHSNQQHRGRVRHQRTYTRIKKQGGFIMYDITPYHRSCGRSDRRHRYLCAHPVHQVQDHGIPAGGNQRLGENRRRRRRADFQGQRARRRKKKQYVIAWLKERGVTVNENELDALIEAAVYELTQGIIPLEGIAIETTTEVSEDKEETNHE